MRLRSIASQFPEQTFSQPEVWSLLKESPRFDTMKSRSQYLLESILLGDSGIESRGFSVSDLPRLFSASAGELNRWHERYAHELAAGALRKALAKDQMDISELDAIIVCTCTGYLCPGVSSYVAESLGAKPSTYLQDIVGLGCGAAIPTLRSAEGFLAANPEAKVGVIAVEVCSAAFYLDDDPGVLISLCLFGDGASASIWDGVKSDGYVLSGFQTLHRPEHREKVRFENEGGFLKNKLHRAVPDLSSDAVLELWDKASVSDVDDIISHGGGKAVVEALRAKIPAYGFDSAAEVLAQHGNLSSPSVLVALEKELERGVGERFWLTSFGAGFAAHSVNLQKS